MAPLSSGQIIRTRPQVVAVVASADDLEQAMRLRRTPDLFELRVDALLPIIDGVETAIARFCAPLIITARHPAEGGLSRLASTQRAALLSRFLPFAACVDIELRSLNEMQRVSEEARQRGVKIILSTHHLRDTPTAAAFDELARTAQRAGADIFKIATRTENASQLARLMHCFDNWHRRITMSAMGIGELGRMSRVQLFRKGSALNYAALSSSVVPGQLSLHELRRLQDRYARER